MIVPIFIGTYSHLWGFFVAISMWINPGMWHFVPWWAQQVCVYTWSVRLLFLQIFLETVLSYNWEYTFCTTDEKEIPAL